VEGVVSAGAMIVAKYLPPSVENDWFALLYAGFVSAAIAYALFGGGE